MPLFTSLVNYNFEESAHNEGREEDHDGKRDKKSDDNPESGQLSSLGGDRTNYPLTLSINDWGEGAINLRVQTAPEIDPQRVLDHVRQTIEVLVAALQAQGIKPLQQLDILPQAQRTELISTFNDTHEVYPQHICLHQPFETQVSRSPQATAVIYAAETLSYQALNDKANQLAHYLIAQGVGPETLVGLCVERSFELVIGILGILKAGGAYVPIDPEHPVARMAYVLSDSGVSMVLTQSHLSERLPVAKQQLLCLDTTECENLTSGLSTQNPDADALGLTSTNLAYVIYTSGTTGQPKGVMNEHGGVYNRLHWMQQRYALCSDDVVLQKTPFGFDVSVWELLWPLMSGAQLVIARPGGHQDPDYLVDCIVHHQISYVHFVPSMLGAFLTAADIEGCTSIKQIICSGEALSRSQVELCWQRLGHASIDNLYGPTEAAIDVTYWPCGEDLSEGHIPIGYPIANTQMYILNQQMQPVPLGVTGELYIGGVGVARGYWHLAELTRQRFIADPFSSDKVARLYRTGDLGCWQADGSIRYLGRNDDQVKIRGLRIEPGEIAAQLQQQANIQEALVLAYEADGGDTHLVAYVTSDAGLELDHVRSNLSRVLPDYMVPAYFIVLEAIPLTANGKVDRKALPTPDDSALAKAQYEAPVGEVEVLLAQIWQDLLPVEQVSRHDNFKIRG
jgi:amino acid adenylation domain-containing protein